MKTTLFLLLSFFVCTLLQAQVGIGTQQPSASAILELQATDKAFLPPRLTTQQRDAILSPAAGMIIFNINTDCLEIYRTTGWFSLCQSGTPGFSDQVIAYPPLPVSKLNTRKIYAHLMPWFETPATNNGNWGIHWTMANRNPEIILPGGQRQIAAHYYPLTGPYASSDTALIDYQLLLMKLSGIDAVLIDWPGTGTNNGANLDLVLNERNTRALVQRISRTGLQFGLVYEDQFLSNEPDPLSRAQADMRYAETTYFRHPAYEKINQRPVLYVFGPQYFQTPASWSVVFSVLDTVPTFYTLWYESAEAGNNAQGEFAWIYPDYLTGLNNFYNNSYPGLKTGSAYPGFRSFYQEGGWSGPLWTIPANGTATFNATLQAALNSTRIQAIQLNTWNDYGEGTMLEPTDTTSGGFGFSLLTTLQQAIGVQGAGEAELRMVWDLYRLRKANSGNSLLLNRLNQVYYYLVAGAYQQARQLLNSF